MAGADAVLEALPDGVVVVDAAGTVTQVNAAAEELLGSLTGRPLAECGAPGAALAALAARAAEGDARRTLGLSTGPVEVRAAPVGDGGRVLVLRSPGRFALLAEDEGELARVTALAAGLAHEIKNPLAGLKGAADLLAREAGAGPLADYATVIAREAGRLDDLVRGLLDLARPRPPVRRPVDLHVLLDELLLLATAGAPGITVARRYDPSLPELPVDRDQLVQVLLNLLKNAVEAMAGAGTLTVATGLALGLSTGSAATGRRTMAQVVVEDEGPGFAPEVLDRPFTPFLTTKAQGTGLGLPLARRLTEAHGGLLELGRRPGGGARVRVLLPVV